MVLLFVLNSLNGRKIINSVNSQFEQWQTDYLPSFASTAQNEQPMVEEKKNETVAIVITSSWIPTHPSTFLVEAVFNSTITHLVGLSPTAPIFITIDYFRFSDYANLPPALEDRINKLEEYYINLLNLYMTDPRVHVIPALKHLHIGGSVMKALNLISQHYPTVKYLYYIQHDFQFIRHVDHTALIQMMEDHPEVNYIRFPKSPRFIRNCGKVKPILYNTTAVQQPEQPVVEGEIDDGAAYDEVNSQQQQQQQQQQSAPTGKTTLTLYPTSQYSDNNHLVRFTWYKDAIASMIKLTRPPENPLQVRANNGCLGLGDPLHGLYIYHEQAIGHLQGRTRKEIP